MVVGRTFGTAGAAKYLHCNIETVRRAWRRGDLAGTQNLLRPGHPVTFTKDALDTFRAARTRSSVPQD